MWFEKLTGFTEESTEQVRSMITLDGTEYMVSSGNGRRYRHGRLGLESLGELRARVSSECNDIGNDDTGQISVSAVVLGSTSEVKRIFLDASNCGAVFQSTTASNLLSIPYPEVTPGDGISAYEFDTSYGASCAMLCGASTLYRNYFAMPNCSAQTDSRQLDCFRELGELLGNDDNVLWQCKNGYVLPSQAGLERVKNRINGADCDELTRLSDAVRIGVQRNAQVTLGAGAEKDADEHTHNVTLALCPALPVAFAPYGVDPWRQFALLVTQAVYEATLACAVLNSATTGTAQTVQGANKVFLTLVGDGAFGNEQTWILQALHNALVKYRNHPLQVFIVVDKSSEDDVNKLVENFN